MSLTTLIQKGIEAAFDSPLVEILADKMGAAQAVPIFKEHFTFTAFEIAKAYQESYAQALAAISTGLAASEQKFTFLQKFIHSKLTREFSEKIDSLYLLPFAKAIAKDSSELRQQLLEQIRALSEQPLIFEAENTPFTESELAVFINDKGRASITDLVLEQLGNQVPALLAQFFRYHELLGNAILFFLREKLRQDERTEKTLAALQREKLLLDNDAIKQGLAEQKVLLQNLMQRFALSKQIKPSDEFTHHTSDSRQLIQAALGKLKGLPSHNTEYNQLVMMTGNVLSSTGDLNNLVAAEQLFQQARDLAQNPADKALACFNLFQIRLRSQDYHHALGHLQTALAIDGPRYALHDVDRYPIIRLLGAGGMGCVFLCHDQWRENQVVVKCFWEGRKGSREEVFGEAMLMRTIAGDYVPKPLDCGYVDASRQERPYFVTEYIEGAEDGETWLAQHGKLDVSTGLAVGLQIAKGLQVAHEQGIYHLDLKPANLLFKQTDTGLLVKIIDFGLARVATSLRQEAMSHRISDQQTQFGQMIIGTLSYAPPEQLGRTEYGPPSAKSDLFSFGATLYRLMTGENPHNLNPRRLADAPPALFELLCDCKEENPAHRPDSIQQVISVLAEIQAKVPKKSEVDTLSSIAEKAQAQTINSSGNDCAKYSPTSPAFPHGEGITGATKKTGGYPHGLDFPSFNNYTDFNLIEHEDERPFLLVSVSPEPNTFSNNINITVGDNLYFKAIIHNNGNSTKRNTEATGTKFSINGFYQNNNGEFVSTPSNNIKISAAIYADNAQYSVPPNGTKTATACVTINENLGKIMRLNLFAVPRIGWEKLCDLTDENVSTRTKLNLFGSVGVPIADRTKILNQVFNGQFKGGGSKIVSIRFYATTELANVDLNITKKTAIPARIQTGENVTITTNYQNDGIIEARNIVITDTYDTNLFDFDRGLDCDCTENSGTITCRVGSEIEVNPGNGGSVSYTLTAKNTPTASTIISTTGVSSNMNDTNPANETADVSVEITESA